MHRAIGISVHTGWGACVVVGGSLFEPEVVANEVVEILGNSERFCFHAAAELKPNAAQKWIERMRERALVNARRGLLPLIAKVSVCAIVARKGQPGDLTADLPSHARIHTAEGYFYRDVFRDACTVPVRFVPPSSLDTSKVGKLAAPPWGRDQKLAALAAWSALADELSRD